MPCEDDFAVFDLGGTWFRSGRYVPSRGLVDAQRDAAISYRSHPHLNVAELQRAMTDFIVLRTRQMQDASSFARRAAYVSIGAPVNAHDQIVLGSGPLWGTGSSPFHLQKSLQEAMPQMHWQVINDITALLGPYIGTHTSYRKTLLVTVSTGIGSRLYDHVAQRIPYDTVHGVQGEIGHLPVACALFGTLLSRSCECGGRDHLNAFSSGRGIAEVLRRLPNLSSSYGAMFDDPPDFWEHAGEDYRLGAFNRLLDAQNSNAVALLDALVTPLARILATALSLDPDIDRIVITGGVVHGLGAHYREALLRAFARDGLYQITELDPDYLARRLHWEGQDDFGGLRGVGLLAQIGFLIQQNTRGEK